MQVFILDNHPLLDDSRRSRHMLICHDKHYDVFRLHVNSKLDKKKSGHIKASCPLYQLGVNSTPLSILNYTLFVLNIIFGKYDYWKRLFEQLGLYTDEPTIVHIHDPVLLLINTQLKKYFRNMKLVYDRHETYEKLSMFRSFSLNCIIEKIMKHKINGVVITVDAYLEQTKRMFPDANVTIVPNYPIISKEEEINVNEKLSRELLTGDVVRFVCIGTLGWTRVNKYSVYDIDPLLYFSKQLINKGYNIQFIIGGKSISSEMTAEFLHMSEKYPDKFKYIGFVSYNDLIKYTMDSTFGFFLTNPLTKYWVFRSSNKIFEFINCGVIPITRDDAYPQNEIKPFSLVFDRYDSNDIILDSIENLLSDYTKINKLRKTLKENYKSYSFKNVSTEYISLYEMLFKSNR